MKIEIDFNADYNTGVARHLLVAAMRCLPDDEVELAVREWQAGIDLDDAGIAGAAGDEIGDMHAEATAAKAQLKERLAEPEPVHSPEATALSEREAAKQDAVEDERRVPRHEPEERFTVYGKSFSTRHRGPASAVKHFLEQAAKIEDYDALVEATDEHGKLKAVLSARGMAGRMEEIRAGWDAAQRRVHDQQAKIVLDDHHQQNQIDEPDQDEIPFGAAPQPAPEAPPAPAKPNGGNGSGMPQETLRSLCRRAQAAIGRPTVVEVMKRHGVTTFDGIDPAVEADLRAEVTRLMEASS